MVMGVMESYDMNQNANKVPLIMGGVAYVIAYNCYTIRYWTEFEELFQEHARFSVSRRRNKKKTTQQSLVAFTL